MGSTDGAADNSRRETNGDRVIGDGLVDDAVRADEATLTDVRARQDRHAVRDPGAGADPDGGAGDLTVLDVARLSVEDVVRIDDRDPRAEAHVVLDHDRLAGRNVSRAPN